MLNGQAIARSCPYQPTVNISHISWDHRRVFKRTPSAELTLPRPKKVSDFPFSRDGRTSNLPYIASNLRERFRQGERAAGMFVATRCHESAYLGAGG